MPLQRKNLESQLATSAAGVEALKQKARQTEIDRKKLELDAGTRTESITRLKTQQYQTRKNDEFQAIGHEIERYENEIRKIEDEELELMVEADKVKGDLAAEEKKAATVKWNVAPVSFIVISSERIHPHHHPLVLERRSLRMR